MKTPNEKMSEWQQLLNAQLWRQLNELSEGNLAELQRKTGITSQTFYNIRENRSFPSVPTLLVLRESFPQVDWDSVQNILGSPGVVKQTAEDWRIKYERMAEQNRQLVSRYVIEPEMSFLLASSIVTPQREPMGFKPKGMIFPRQLTYQLPVRCRIGRSR